MSALPWVGRLAPRIYDSIAGPGPRPSAAVRTRLIDDLIAERAPQSQQFVILGAGFDTRALRLSCLSDLVVFEVDQPATQAEKRQVLRRCGACAANVRYVGVDFESDPLDRGLSAAGFAGGTRSLFLWEGVTNYLSAGAVDQTLRVIRSLSRRCTLIFTYVHAGVLDGSTSFPEAARWLRGVERAGEPWTFGLDPSETGAYLAHRGYRLEMDVSTRDAGDRWLPSMGRSEQGSALYRVAVARTS